MNFLICLLQLSLLSILIFSTIFQILTHLNICVKRNQQDSNLAQLFQAKLTQSNFYNNCENSNLMIGNNWVIKTTKGIFWNKYFEWKKLINTAAAKKKRLCLLLFSVLWLIGVVSVKSQSLCYKCPNWSLKQSLSSGQFSFNLMMPICYCCCCYSAGCRLVPA